MPDSNPGLNTILAHAQGLTDPVERAAYLDQVCAGDSALRNRIDSLLATGNSTAFFVEPDATVGHDALLGERGRTVSVGITLKREGENTQRTFDG